MGYAFSQVIPAGTYVFPVINLFRRFMQIFF